MMKFLLSGLMLSVLSFTANAVLITDTVGVNNWFDTKRETVSWTHDITDDGFNLGSDTVNSASLSFTLTDDEDDWLKWGIIPKGYEVAKIIIHEIDFEDGGFFEIDAGVLDLNVGISGVASLNDYGLLSVSVTKLYGDFGLGDVSLIADVTAASVPESGSFALLGLGLLGLGAVRRKKV